MTAPRPGNPDICPLCAAELRRVPGSGHPYHVHPHRTDCLLRGFKFDDTPENVAKWNRRVGKPLWAKPRKPERPWEDPDYLATHPKTKEETRK